MESPYIIQKIIKTIRKYNPNYGDDKVCKCGHTYERHFDSCEDMEDVGCKYCECENFELRVETQEYSRYPKTLEEFRERIPDAENFCYAYDNYHKRWSAYLMGCGAEDLVASFDFPSKEAIVQFYKDNGIERCFGI